MYLKRPPYVLRKTFKKLICTIPVKETIIYLTFDDGPTPEVTPWVLETLAKHNAKATFFCVGKNVIECRNIYERIIKEGHAVGNHTYSHLNGWRTSTEKYIEDINKCKQVISNPNTLFRPPYGKIKPRQYNAISKDYSIIMWDVLSCDFDKDISKEKCFKIVASKATNGSIVVFHDSIKAKESLYHTLPRALKFFAKKGFEFRAITNISKTWM